MKKNAKKKSESNKDKLISDLWGREEDRVLRENEILKDLQGINKGFQSVEKHLRKMVRKMLMITAD